MQSTPKQGLLSFCCWALMFARYSIPWKPLFSAKQIGIWSKASAKALIAYCSVDEIYFDFKVNLKKKNNH